MSCKHDSMFQKTEKNDSVNHPKHYTSLGARCHSCNAEIECIEITRHMGFNLGNAIKYLWRANFKGKEIEDLQKAIWYINDLIKTVQGRGSNGI